MIKFKIGAEQSNAIDVCTHCGLAWLDDGEWELLSSLALQSRLTNIFTEPWQRRIRTALAEESETRRDEEAIGTEAMRRVDEIVSWIQDHPKKEDILRILRKKIG